MVRPVSASAAALPWAFEEFAVFSGRSSVRRLANPRNSAVPSNGDFDKSESASSEFQVQHHVVSVMGL
jgi:hypothetical protein